MIKISPHRPGDGGIICLPLKANIPDPGGKHPDWRLTKCSICGAECWESALARDALKEEPDLRAACTTCALTAGTNTNQGGDQHGQDPTNPREHPAHGKGRV